MNLLVVDDHPLVRRGLISLLSSNNDLHEIKEAGSLAEAVSIIKREKPEIALVDLKLGQDNGLEVIEQGKKISPDTKFLILTSFISHEDFLRAEEIGLDGYILKEALAEDIIYAINVIQRGKKYYDPEVVSYKSNREEYSITDQLTDREKDVLMELGKGISNDEIAKKLYISSNTVKKHVSSILSKLNLNHRAQAVLLVNNKSNI